MQAAGHFLLTLIALVPVGIHGAKQTFKTAFQDVLEAVQVGSTLHAALQAIDLLAQLVIQVAGGAGVVGMAFAGFVQMALERFEAFVELLQVTFKFVLAAVVDGQHQHCQVIEHRQQFVPVQPVLQAFAQGLRLCLVAFGQGQVVKQAEQCFLNVRGDRAVGGLGTVRQLEVIRNVLGFEAVGLSVWLCVQVVFGHCRRCIHDCDWLGLGQRRYRLKVGDQLRLTQRLRSRLMQWLQGLQRIYVGSGGPEFGITLSLQRRCGMDDGLRY
ncbi:hypothetical protein D3C77_324670 [compost metagenome]